MKLIGNAGTSYGEELEIIVRRVLWLRKRFVEQKKRKDRDERDNAMECCYYWKAD